MTKSTSYHSRLSSPESFATRTLNESFDKYSEETDTCHPLAELLDQLWQLKDEFTSLKSITLESTPTTELMQLIDKLQHLTMMLQPHSAPPV